ncbi:hypothetical protein BC835DRAFT_1519336 [Cytidiella melzeri]|nr:hypothetical protein BC835DRAFT_1519336 [Cytidiella melzeri]
MKITELTVKNARLKDMVALNANFMLKESEDIQVSPHETYRELVSYFPQYPSLDRLVSLDIEEHLCIEDTYSDDLQSVPLTPPLKAVLYNASEYSDSEADFTVSESDFGTRVLAPAPHVSSPALEGTLPMPSRIFSPAIPFTRQVRRIILS